MRRSGGSRRSSATTSCRRCKRNSGNISHAARAADIDRKYFRKLMKKYDIEAAGVDDDDDARSLTISRTSGAVAPGRARQPEDHRAPPARAAGARRAAPRSLRQDADPAAVAHEDPGDHRTPAARVPTAQAEGRRRASRRASTTSSAAPAPRRAAVPRTFTVLHEDARDADHRQARRPAGARDARSSTSTRSRA